MMSVEWNWRPLEMRWSKGRVSSFSWVIHVGVGITQDDGGILEKMTLSLVSNFSYMEVRPKDERQSTELEWNFMNRWRGD